MLTVVCVHRKMPRSPYSAIWVKRLAAGVKKHCSVPYRMVCLTDDPTPVPGVELIPLEHPNWPGKGWWSKLEVFKPGKFEGPVVYLDLDTLVVGDVARLVPTSRKLIAPRNYGGAPGFCSTAFGFEGGFGLLYSRFAAEPEKFSVRWDQFRKGGIGDQAFMAETLMNEDLGWDYYPDHLVPSYKHHCRHGYPHKADAVAIAFHGNPKMDQLNDWAGIYWETLG